MDERLSTPELGVDVVLMPAGGDCAAGDFQFDVIGVSRGFITQPHVHTAQSETYAVISGEMLLKLGGKKYLLRAGDRMTTPAGAAHSQLPGNLERGHVRVTVSPAGDTEAFLRRLASLSESGQLNRFGMPRPVAAARLIEDFGASGHGTVPPVAVQRVLARAILAVAGLWRPYAFVDEWDVAGAGPEEVFDALADGRSYPQWWRPVYIDVEAGGAPEVGAVATQHFKGRLPYHLHTRSEIVAMEPGSSLDVEVDGDLRGHGRWTVMPLAGGAGTHVRFDWTVHADRRLLKVLTPLLRPLFRWNHAWAIARAMDGLEPWLAAQRADDRASVAAANGAVVA